MSVKQAFYLDLALYRNLDLDLDRACAHVRDLDRDLDIDFAARARARFPIAIMVPIRRLIRRRFPHRNLALDRNLAHVLAHAEDPELKRRLQEIYDRLPNRDDHDRFQQWWEQNGDRWTEDIRQIMIKYRNIGHDWQFTDEQKAKLQEYYDANLLLTNCLNSECYVSREVREEIESTMLLPIASIEKWKAENRPT